MLGMTGVINDTVIRRVGIDAPLNCIDDFATVCTALSIVPYPAQCRRRLVIKATVSMAKISTSLHGVYGVKREARTGRMTSDA